MFPPIRPRPIIASCIARSPKLLSTPSTLIDQIEILVAEQDRVRDPDKEARVHDSWNSAKPILKLRRVFQTWNPAIENVIAVVGQEATIILFVKNRLQAHVGQVSAS